MLIWAKKLKHYKNIKNVFSYKKMSKEILTLGDIEIEKNLYHHKTPILGGHVDIEKVLLSSKISFSEV